MSTPSIKWKTAGGTVNSSEPTIAADGTVFITGSSTIQAISPQGAVLWVRGEVSSTWSIDILADKRLLYVSGDAVTRDFGGGSPIFFNINTAYGTPGVGEDGTMFVGGLSVTAVRAGIKPRWAVSGAKVCGEPCAFASDFAIAPNGTIIFGASDHKVHAIDATGQIRWSFDAPDLSDRATAAISDEGIIYVGGTAKLHALDINGKEQFSVDAPTGPMGAPALGPEGTIFVAGGGALRAVSPQGQVKWTVQYGDATEQSSPAVDKSGRVYVGGSGKLHAIDSTGTEVWAIDVGTYLSAVAIGGGGKLYLCGSVGVNRYLFAIGD